MKYSSLTKLQKEMEQGTRDIEKSHLPDSSKLRFLSKNKPSQKRSLRWRDWIVNSPLVGSKVRKPKRAL